MLLAVIPQKCEVMKAFTCPTVRQIIKGISKANSKQEFCMERCTWLTSALRTGYRVRAHMLKHLHFCCTELIKTKLIKTTHLQVAQPHLHSAFRHSLVHPSLVSLVILTAVGHKSDHSGGGMVEMWFCSLEKTSWSWTHHQNSERTSLCLWPLTVMHSSIQNSTGLKTTIRALHQGHPHSLTDHSNSPTPLQPHLLA